MMTCPNFLFFLTCLFVGNVAAHQDVRFISAHVGDNVTLSSLYMRDYTKYYLYKQTLGQMPMLVCIMKIWEKTYAFYNEFEKNPRFSIQEDAGFYHVNISDVQLSDSATYLYAVNYIPVVEFREAITVSVDMSQLNIQALVQQSSSEKIQPGGSVTLSCTVHTGACDDGEPSVYWLKNSQEPLRGILYTKGDRRAQCKRKNNSQTHTCVHKLPIKSLNLSDAGIYYCAVAACGQILFGNGTKVDFKAADELLVYLMSGALTFTTLLSVFLSFLLYKRDRGSGSCARSSAGSTTSEEGNGDKDGVHYAALSVHLPNRPRRQTDNAMDECVYSSVRH